MYTFLLAEDYHPDILLFRKAIKELGLPVRLIEVRNGEEAWTKLQTESIDLIISDLKMPELGGVDLLKRINQDSRLKMIPFIIFSNSINPEDIQKAYEHYANSYLQKPGLFEDLKELLAKVHDYWLNTNERI